MKSIGNTAEHTVSGGGFIHRKEPQPQVYYGIGFPSSEGPGSMKFARAGKLDAFVLADRLTTDVQEAAKWKTPGEALQDWGQAALRVGRANQGWHSGTPVLVRFQHTGWTWQEAK